MLTVIISTQATISLVLVLEIIYNDTLFRLSVVRVRAYCLIFPVERYRGIATARAVIPSATAPQDTESLTGTYRWLVRNDLLLEKT